MSRNAALAALTTVIALAFPCASSADPYWGPGYTSCGRHLFAIREGGHVRLYIAARHARCRKALAIQREYWGAPRKRLRIVNGGSGAAGYVLLKRYPGWRCTSGAGAGGCSRHSASSNYSYRRT